jgi:hypothetical protein
MQCRALRVPLLCEESARSQETATECAVAGVSLWKRASVLQYPPPVPGSLVCVRRNMRESKPPICMYAWGLAATVERERSRKELQLCYEEPILKVVTHPDLSFRRHSDD